MNSSVGEGKRLTTGMWCDFYNHTCDIDERDTTLPMKSCSPLLIVSLRLLSWGCSPSSRAKEAVMQAVVPLFNTILLNSMSQWETFCASTLIA